MANGARGQIRMGNKSAFQRRLFDMPLYLETKTKVTVIRSSKYLVPV